MARTTPIFFWRPDIYDDSPILIRVCQGQDERLHSMQWRRGAFLPVTRAICLFLRLLVAISTDLPGDFTASKVRFDFNQVDTFDFGPQ